MSALTNDIVQLSAAEIAARVRGGQLHAIDVTDAMLERIGALDAQIGAYLALDTAGARAQARAVDASIAGGEVVGPLAGVPVGLKDIFVTRGQETTCASKILRGWIPPYDATVVERLRSADAVILGKLNMDEFAMGSSTENSARQVTHNPWDLERTPGGSSGGSAAAVAAVLCTTALGTDTGGSIRQPAAMCGIVGMKPTYGRVSRYGVIAFASSLDQVGPLGRTVEDCALMLSVLAGQDARDATSLPAPVADYVAACGRGIAGMRVGVPREYWVDGMDAEVHSAVRVAIDKLQSLGATVVEISLPHTKYAVATYYLVAPAEASSNLARYDGVRYGLRAADARDLLDLYQRTRDEGFGPEVKRRIMLGTYVLSAGYYDAYYGRAQKVRTLIRRDFEQAFASCDVIATPTSPSAAFRLGERVDDPLQMYLADIFTISCNLAGIPGLSLPCGFTKAGLPIGLQVLGPPLGEEKIFQAAAVYQNATDWHTRRPSSPNLPESVGSPRS